MKSILRTTRGLLAAGLALAAVSVQAASGFAVSRTQETSVEVGMSASQVEQILGRPAERFTYRSASGPTWTYYVAGSPYGTTAFDVTFGSDGRVVSAREFWQPSGG